MLKLHCARKLIGLQDYAFITKTIYIYLLRIDFPLPLGIHIVIELITMIKLTIYIYYTMYLHIIKEIHFDWSKVSMPFNISGITDNVKHQNMPPHTLHKGKFFELWKKGF